MESIKRGQLQEEIEKATVEFMDTNEELTLEVKGNSVCHFFPRFRVENEEIQLRLDWSEIDGNSYPVLDADFYCANTGKKKSLKNHRLESHNTNTVPGKGREYVWSYKECTRPFRVKILWLARIEENVAASMKAEATVIKGKKS